MSDTGSTDTADPGSGCPSTQSALRAPLQTLYIVHDTLIDLDTQYRRHSFM